MTAPALTAAEAAPAVERWEPAKGTVVRGTVVLLPGRGEHPGAYARLGRRLAFDGYRLLVPEARHLAEPSAPTGAEPVADVLASGVDRAVLDLAVLVAEQRERDGGPVVLAGSDTGALLALAAAGTAPVDGLLLAGLPGQADEAADWAEDELSARTACPVHRGLLAGSAEFRPGALLDPVPTALADAASAARPTVPVLAFHGLDDPVAPVEALRALTRRLPTAEAVGVADGRHDVFNDAAHRSVAARTVQWLEALRANPHRLPAPPPALLLPLPDSPAR